MCQLEKEVKNLLNARIRNEIVILFHIQQATALFLGGLDVLSHFLTTFIPISKPNHEILKM